MGKLIEMKVSREPGPHVFEHLMFNEFVVNDFCDSITRAC